MRNHDRYRITADGKRDTPPGRVNKPVRDRRPQLKGGASQADDDIAMSKPSAIRSSAPRPPSVRTMRAALVLLGLVGVASCAGGQPGTQSPSTQGPPTEDEVTLCAAMLADVATNYFWGPPPDTVNVSPWEKMVLGPVGGRVDGSMTLGSRLAVDIASAGHVAKKAGENEYQAIMLGAGKACSDRANLEAVMNP